jgi:hypothetical protein
MPGRSYAHVDWHLIKSLALQGVSLAELAKRFDIGYRAILARSSRQKWRIAAVRAQVPPLDPETKKLLKERSLNAHKEITRLSTDCRAKAAKILGKFFDYYDSAHPELISDNSQSIAAMVAVATKFFAWNDGKLAEGRPSLNLAVLALKPEGLARVVHEVGVQRLTNSDPQDVAANSSGVVGEIAERCQDNSVSS